MVKRSPTNFNTTFRCFFTKRPGFSRPNFTGKCVFLSPAALVAKSQNALCFKQKEFYATLCSTEPTDLTKDLGREGTLPTAQVLVFGSFSMAGLRAQKTLSLKSRS
jgi:hypothetical protein